MAIPEGEDGQTNSQQQQQLTPPSLKTDRPIQLRVVSQHAYVWDIEDVKRLRVDHHICGVLVGTLPQVAQQNIFLGLPLQLLPEEAAVLVAHGLAVLVNDNAAHTRASVKQAAAHAELRLQGIKEQQDSYIQQEKEKQAHMQAKYGAQIQKKREEKAEKRRKAAEAKLVDGLLGDVETSTSGSAGAGTCANEQPDQEPEIVSGTSEAQLAASAQTHTVGQASTSTASTSKRGSIPNVPFSIITETATSSSIHPWYHPEPHTLDSLEASSHVPPHSSFMLQVKSALFPFPVHSNGMQLARYKVFEDLWLKGYYMGKGLKFGGDYLCYPGDPLRFHSHFTAIVVESPSEGIYPLDIVSWGRLATAVKKACLLASWDNKTQQVRYLSLEWAGFG